MENSKSGKKTLLLSVILSSFGPLVVGLGLKQGKSATQLADFVRRSIELLAIILSYIVFCITSKEDSRENFKKENYENFTNIFVSIAMIISGLVMTFLVLTSKGNETGNVTSGLIIAISGVVANSLFHRKYKRLFKESGNKILEVQSKLYLAKTFVDTSVTIALGVVLLSTNPTVSYCFDLVGTICVSIYMIFTGAKSMISTKK